MKEAEETVVIGGCVAIKGTEKGLQVRFADGAEHWIARGQIARESKVREVNNQGNLIIPRWLADRCSADSGQERQSSAGSEAETNRRRIENQPYRGILFLENDTRNNRPDYKGGVNVGGVEFRVAAWKKTSKKNGAEFLSLVFDPTEPPKTQGEGGPPDEDLPF